jgi:2-alkenal reductase
MHNSVKRIVALFLLTILVMFAFYVGTTVVSPRASASAVWPEVEVLQQEVPANVSEEEQQLASVYNQVVPSVVSINVVARQAGSGSFAPQDELALGTGTGFVIDTQGHIVTNNHVVEGATRIEVNFFDGTIVRGEVVGLDPDSDLAVIQVDVAPEELQPITFGDSDSLFIGQEVVAIGSPFGQRWTMTSGIVSALDRTIEGLTGFSIGSVIQTDAAINPGNSGGPLVNLQGQVIGVNSQIMSQTRSSSGIGFAVPSNLTQRVAQALIDTGSVEYSYLGISGRAITLSDIEALTLPSDARGVVIEYVEPGGPADQAGLRQPGNPVSVDGIPTNTSVDIITAIDGEPVTDMPVLIAYLAENTQPGQTVNLTVVRDGNQEMGMPLTLGARPGGN